jgi:hypothetical protein
MGSPSRFDLDALDLDLVSGAAEDFLEGADAFDAKSDAHHTFA